MISKDKCSQILNSYLNGIADVKEHPEFNIQNTHESIFKILDKLEKKTSSIIRKKLNQDDGI